ncbi:hypothetical protein NB693_21470 [Pantoea ananatis]|uniref:dioxygenase family protein n=1 Tax=Pantoea ananas TaxID=553 RepID=UPI00221EC6F6|nr:hypothetical protein [Pantoea ananatis]
MSVKIFETPEVQAFLRTVSGLEQTAGDARVKRIVHRVLSDLFKAIDDLDVTPDVLALYVAGAPVAHGFARLDDGSDENGHPLIMHGTVYAADGRPLPGATVEVWHWFVADDNDGVPPGSPTEPPWPASGTSTSSSAPTATAS